LFAEALDYGRQAYDEDFKVLGGNHPELAYSLSCIGESLIGLQNYAGAIDALKKAYSLRQNHRAPRSNLAWTGWLLGRALVESGARVNEGRQYIRDARSVLAALGGAAESEVRDIDKWLERYPDQES